MVYVNNNETIKELNDAIKGDFVSNIAPKSINNSVQPVININPKDYKIINIVKSNTSGTIYATPTNKDFYLRGITLSGSSITAGLCRININANVQDMGAVDLLQLALQVSAAVPAASDTQIIIYPIPLKITRNTNIAFTSAGTVEHSQACIFGTLE